MNILIIEDDDFFRNFYAQKLQEAGATVDTARNGEEGLLKLKQFNPQLIILDIIMPVKDGFQFLTEFSQNPQVKQIPVLVFSTLGQESDVEKAKQLGASDYVNKSYFDLTLLFQKIEQLTGVALTNQKPPQSS